MDDNFSVDGDVDIIHVYPLFGREHVILGLNCWCHPERDEAEPRLVIHNVEH